MAALVASFVGILAAGAVGFVAQAQSPPDYTGDCTRTGCHDEYAKRSFAHDPVAEGSCDACHTKAAEKEHHFEFVAEKKSLCIECHEEFEGKTRRKIEVTYT